MSRRLAAVILLLAAAAPVDAAYVAEQTITNTAYAASRLGHAVSAVGGNVLIGGAQHRSTLPTRTSHRRNASSSCTRAADCFDALLTQDEQDMDANCYLGFSLLKQTRHIDSLRYLLRAEDLGSKQAELYEAIGWSLFNVGDFERSAAYYRKSLQAGNSSVRDKAATAHVHAGNAFLSTGATEQAVLQFRSALSLGPSATIVQAVSSTLGELDKRGQSTDENVH